MQVSVRRVTFSQFIATAALLLAVMCVVVPTVGAQSGAGATPTQPARPIEELTAQWASLELPLLGVAELSDLQRDAIELLEERYRKLFNDEAGPIRAARVTLLQRGPFERQQVERALARMSELRKRELTQLRTLLTEGQRVKYDENLKVIAQMEAAAETKREREAAFVTP